MSFFADAELTLSGRVGTKLTAATRTVESTAKSRHTMSRMGRLVRRINRLN